MRNHEIEAWALGIIDRVIQKQPIEDDRVELKAEWPDALKAARRIAGHANAARGEPILWLIGVDEKAGAIPRANALNCLRFPDVHSYTVWPEHRSTAPRF